MAKKDNRFVVKRVANEVFGMSTIIIVDIETGVQYLCVSQGYGGGVTPLLGPDGKVLLDNSYKYND